MLSLGHSLRVSGTGEGSGGLVDIFAPPPASCATSSAWWAAISAGVVCQLPTKRFFFDEEVEAVGWPVNVYLEQINQDVAALALHLDRSTQHLGTPAPNASR